MRRALLLIGLTAIVILCGCSTHRADLAASYGVQTSSNSPDSALVSAARTLVEHEAANLDSLSAVSLAPLTSAAATLAQSTPSPQLVSITRRLAGLLAEARIGPSGTFGVSTDGQPPRASVSLTAAAGLAFLDAYHATGDPGDASAALAAATALHQSRLGWQDTPAGAGMRVGRGLRSIDIAETAAAALLWLRTSQLGHPALSRSAADAFRTVFDNQAAVGRWYAVRGTHHPMSVLQWAETLYALQRSRLRTALGITGAGIPALRLEAFERSGRPTQSTGSDPVGTALACATIASYPVSGVNAQVFAVLLAARRSDGTIRLAADGDTAAQAGFAQALAQRVATLQATK